MSEEKVIPYKIYLEESEMPRQWYNVRAHMKNKPAPLLNKDTLKPITFEELQPVFCDELIKQELDEDTAYFDIPQEILDFYKMYRPSPLVRAYCLEKKLGTPAHIYYKFEGNNTSGSHKLNSAIAQAYYAKNQGLKGVTTETGAGQWGTALSMACAYLGLDCNVFMVKVSYEQKPFRREVMRTYGASVTPSPSMTTEVGRKINEEFPGTTGSLGCAISEAVEAASTKEGYRYVLGSVLNQVMLHQSIIGLETKAALDKYDIQADIDSVSPEDIDNEELKDIEVNAAVVSIEKNKKDLETAKTVAKSVICSSLLKAAMFGSDANWGRVLCAIGYSGAEVDVLKVDVSFSSKKGEIAVCKNGAGVDFSEEKAKEILLEDEIEILVGLNSGDASATAWGCDLTYDYVKINGDYRT